MKFHSNSRTGFKTKQNNNESTEQLDGRGPESRVGLKKDGQCGGWGSGRAQASESPGDPPGQPGRGGGVGGFGWLGPAPG